MLPDIYLFNPTCETAIANNSPYFVANKRLLKFEADLSLLPQVFAKKNDVVLIDKIPDNEILDLLSQAGFVLPSLIEKQEAFSAESFICKPKQSLKPWGWSPVAHNQLNILKSSCSDEFLKSPAASWTENSRDLYSRKTALAILREILLENQNGIFQTIDDLPKVCKSESDVFDYYNHHHPVVLKAPWSSSGRGLLPLIPTQIRDFHKQWISGILKKQGYLMAEPFFDKKLDFSFHFRTTPHTGAVFMGNTWFETGNKGQYIRNLLGEHHELIKNEAYQFLKPYLEETTAILKEKIDNSILRKNYSGILGVDAFVYRDEKRRFRIHPCLEINCRYTMGMVSMALNEIIHPEATGDFYIFSEQNLSYPQFYKQHIENNPLVLSNSKPIKGFLPLTPVATDTIFGAYALLNG